LLLLKEEKYSITIRDGFKRVISTRKRAKALLLLLPG